MKKKYTKSTFNTSQLYEKLVNQGLKINAANNDKAAIFTSLRHIGYFRLSGYCLPFQQKNAQAQKVFKKNVEIHHILDLYHLNIELRSLILKYLANIEIALRTSICEKLCSMYGPFWYLEQKCFQNAEFAQDVLWRAADAVCFDLQDNKPALKSKPLFLEHYYETYNDPAMPPAWILRECASFGFWSQIFVNLENDIKNQIANDWKFPNNKLINWQILESWLHSLTIVRNSCAHSNRITDTTFPFTPKVPDQGIVKDRFYKGENFDLRVAFLIMDVLLHSLNPLTQWKNEIKALLQRFEAPHINMYKAIGFKGVWQQDILWDDWKAPNHAKKK